MCELSAAATLVQSAAPATGPGAVDAAPGGAGAGSVAAGDAGPDPPQAASARAAAVIAEAAAAGAHCQERIPPSCHRIAGAPVCPFS